VKTIIGFFKNLLRRSRKKRNESVSSAIDAQYLIQRAQHQVSKTNMSSNALTVLNRLNHAGYQAYLVGGSIRDMLLHKAPKDFDIATNATPAQIKKLFRNARIIGRRFKLVHILYHREIIEVATFRGHDSVDDNHKTSETGILIRDNVYGTLQEDAWRRDFTINCLYYTLTDNTIVDYTGGFNDIRQRVIRMIGDPATRYQEDPVRMLRAIRFSAKLDFEIATDTAKPIHEMNAMISHISGSRLFEEMVKIYQCGTSVPAQRMLEKYGLFALLFPQTEALMQHPTYPTSAFINLALESTDTRIQANKTVTPAFIFAVILWFPLLERAAELKASSVEPLPALDQAMAFVLSAQNKIVTIPKRFTQVMREIWLLQFRFDKRTGHRAFTLLEHPRFRAAYDFMALRALAGDESMALAHWWTNFQELTLDKQTEMVKQLTSQERPSTNKRRLSKQKPSTSE
jgi:poly(A) polymerase